MSAQEYHENGTTQSVSNAVLLDAFIAHSNEQLHYYRALQMGISDNNQTGAVDSGLLAKECDVSNHCIGRFPMKTNMLLLLHSVRRRRINDYFPINGNGIVCQHRREVFLISWLRTDDYDKSFEQ